MSNDQPSHTDRPDQTDQLTAALQLIDYPDADAATQTELAFRGLASAEGPLGVLPELAAWVASVQACSPPRDFRRVRAVVLAGDHGIAAAGVSSHPGRRTSDELTRLAAGGGLLNVTAAIAEASVRLVDLSVDGDTPGAITNHKVRRGTGRVDREDAMTADECRSAIQAGRQLADEEIDAGTDLLVLGDLGAGSTTVAAALISVLTGSEPARVVGRGAGIDDATWAVKCAAIRDARRRGIPVKEDLPRLLTAIGGPDFAAAVGLLAQAAGRRTPVLLDGAVSAAAALAVQSQSPRIVRWLRAGRRSSEPAQRLAVERLGLTPVADFELATGSGAAALLAVPVLRAAIRALGSADV